MAVAASPVTCEEKLARWLLWRVLLEMVFDMVLAMVLGSLILLLLLLLVVLRHRLTLKQK